MSSHAPAAAGHHEPSKYHFYIKVAMILSVVTGIEVVLVYLPLPKWFVVTSLLVLSAGFDAHAADPLAQLRVREADFAWLTEALCGLAERCCQGRLVSILEGGYDLEALGRSVAAHVRTLMRA